MKVCILSDSHDHIALLDAAAVTASRTLGAEAVLHCGDVVAPGTLGCLQAHGLPTHVIHGNNIGDLYTLGRIATRPDSVVRYHGTDAAPELGGRRIFLVHYPRYARAMAASGDWDLVCCGHGHRTRVEWLPNLKGGTTPVVDPGTVGGVGRAPATWILGDLDTLTFDLQAVDKSLEQQVG